MCSAFHQKLKYGCIFPVGYDQMIKKFHVDGITRPHHHTGGGYILIRRLKLTRRMIVRYHDAVSVVVKCPTDNFLYINLNRCFNSVANHRKADKLLGSIQTEKRKCLSFKPLHMLYDILAVLLSARQPGARRRPCFKTAAMHHIKKLYKICAVPPHALNSLKLMYGSAQHRLQRFEAFKKSVCNFVSVLSGNAVNTAFVRAAEVKGSTYYRVRIGPYASKAEAQAALPEVAQASGTRPLVVSAD